jgi:hypothetical protein
VKRKGVDKNAVVEPAAVVSASLIMSEETGGEESEFVVSRVSRSSEMEVVNDVQRYGGRKV